jgi:hypothetical protein
MKNLIKWMKALRLYYVMRSCCSYWYRESTNEWVYEVHINIPNEYDCTSRYTHKYKHLCWANWLKYFWSCVSDLRNYA